MATVDQLVIEIRAETAALRKGLNKVQTQLGSVNKAAKSSMLTFGNLSRVFATIGIVSLGRNIVKTTQMFEDLEATLQANTGSAAETAQALDMIKIFTAQTTFQIDEVTRAFLEFRRIGIKPTEEDLRGIGNVAAAQGVGIDSIAQAIFKAGTTSIESLQALGFEGKTEGDKITLSFSGITETVDKSTEGVMSFVRSIGEIKFPEAIKQRANTLTGAFSNLGDASSLFMDEIGRGGLKDVLIDLARDMSVLLVESLDTAKVIGGVFRKAFELTGKAIKTALEFIKGFTNEIIALMAIGIGLKLASMGIAFVKLVKSITLATAATKLFNLAMKASPIFLLVAGVAKFTIGLEALGEKVKTFITDFDEAMGVSETFDEMLKGLTVDTSDLEESLNNVNEVTHQVTNTVEEAAKVFDEDLQQAVVNSSQAFTKDFVDSLLDGQSALESFKNFSRNIVSQIIAIFLQMEVVNRILSHIFPNFTGTVGTGLFDGTSAVATGSGGGTQGTTSFRNPLGTNAGGGKVQRGTPTLVGERGAEIFVPNTGGTIMNNMNSKNAMGGQPIIVNQSVNFATGVVPTVRAEVQKMLPQISDVTKGAVLEAAVRGGSFRKGLLGSG